MDSAIKTCLYDILQSINEIDTYYHQKPRIFNEYVEDIKTKRAVERNLEIIGEAMNRILKIDRSFNLNNAEKIVGTQNRIIHGYDKISDELIWSILINHLPKLKTQVSKMLEE
jgi:uncharacterized protein with HEPN domain